MTNYSSTFRDNRAGRTMVRAFLRAWYHFRPAEIDRLCAGNVDVFRAAHNQPTTIAELARALAHPLSRGGQ
jgi:iron-sulfur cluster repair protein YtfE (RIC family)